MDLRILPPEGFLEGRLMLPLSKSMSARAIIINALTPGSEPLSRVAECDDTAALVRAIYGDVEAGAGHRDINVGAAGTTMRFLTAFYACQPGCDVTIDGSERMRERPIGVLVEALRALGADIAYEGKDGFPPLRIRGRRLTGGAIEMDASVSSQYVSALLMIAPMMRDGLVLTLSGEITSRPYIQMTLGMMRTWGGVDGELYDHTVTVPATPYRKPEDVPAIEGDWSSAAAWYETVAMSAGVVTIDNLEHDSCQGDKCLADMYARLGVDTQWEGEDGGTDLTANPDADARASIDFSDCPDLAQYVTVTCVMLGIPFSFTGLHTLAIKETDRVEALRMELAKVGVMLETPEAGTLSWDGRRVPIRELPVFDTYHDHRMAMCLAPIALYIPGIIIRDAEVVSKSYPDFWEDMRAVGFTLLDAAEDPEAPADEDAEDR
ncbi:MAG: 3-phosphoshikimate 1-carboxyvinyltransferase [Duncaniella sp.]|nr:3-phosphoshikimate 1-carboxyvinyltransferase [Duncaniella sp.]